MRCTRWILTLCLWSAAACVATPGGQPGFQGSDLERPAALVRAPGRGAQAAGLRASPLHWEIDDRDIERIEDDWERSAARLVDGLIGEDRRRMLRHFGAPVLFSPRTAGPERVDFLRADERTAEAHDAYLGGVGLGTLRRPLRDAARELQLVGEVEEVLEGIFDDFRDERRPLEPHGDGGAGEQAEGEGWGRLTVRIRGTDPADGVLVGYQRDWLRVRSSFETLRLGVELPLWTEARARLGWTHRYAGGEDSLRLEFAWAIDRDTSLHVSAANRMDFFDGPTAWSQDRSPVDGTPGAVFYVEQIF